MIKKFPFYSLIGLLCLVVSPLLLSNSYTSPFFVKKLHNDKIWLMGSIQYPMNLEKIPMLRIYCGGNKIKCEANDDNKKLNFSFADSRKQTTFYILITEQIEFVTENNVVLCLKVPSLASYKLYVLNRIESEYPKDKTAEQPTMYKWDIQPIELEEDRKMPDNAIIVCDNPDYVSEIVGESAGSDDATVCELPKIVMRSDLLHVVGSEEKLHEHAAMLRLAAIDSDTIHSWRQNIQSTVNKQAKTIVALTA